MSGEQEKQDTTTQTAGSGNGSPMWAKTAVFHPAATTASALTEAQKQDYPDHLKDLLRRSSNSVDSLVTMIGTLAKNQTSSSFPVEVTNALNDTQEKLSALTQDRSVQSETLQFRMG